MLEMLPSQFQHVVVVQVGALGGEREAKGLSDLTHEGGTGHGFSSGSAGEQWRVETCGTAEAG